MTQSHTPEIRVVKDQFGNLCLKQGEYVMADIIRPTDKDRANADQLALCWNSHADLVAALKLVPSYLADTIKAAEERGEQECADIVRADLKTIQAALNRAGF